MTISHVSSKLKNRGFSSVWNFPSLIEDRVKLSVAPSFIPKVTHNLEAIIKRKLIT
jgi:hypothetical protein